MFAPTRKTYKKTVLIDSSDRDLTKYYTNGDFVIYLPRVYENVVSIRLVAGEFPPLIVSGGGPGACTHSYINGANVAAVYSTGSTGSGPKDTNGNYMGDFQVGASAPYKFPYYFLIDMEGLNKSDETTYAGQKSTFSDSFFAKIPAIANSTNGSTYLIEYNDHDAQENIAQYSPAVARIDRLHIRTRLHYQQDRNGFLYWTTSGAVAPVPPAPPGIVSGADYSLTLEFEMLERGPPT